MNNIGLSRNEIHPLYQFLLLLVYAVLGALVFTLLALGIIVAVNGSGVMKDVLTANMNANNLGIFKTLQIAYTIGFALAPPIMLAVTEKQRITSLYTFRIPKIQLLGLVLAITIVSMPFMEWTVELNQNLKLPPALKSVEEWMRTMEDSAEKQTEIFLKVNSIGGLLLNMIIIALAPAIAEELMFRGGVQRAFTRLFSNPHIAIWLSAFIFSAIHMQFFGFLPRMLLGACFGYFYYWSKNLWYAIFAHFLNNAFAVLMAYYLQKNNLPFDSPQGSVSSPWYGYLISAVITVTILLFFKKLTKEDHGQQLG